MEFVNSAVPQLNEEGQSRPHLMPLLRDEEIYSSDSIGSSSYGEDHIIRTDKKWSSVEVRSEFSSTPCQRSLHSGTVWEDNLLIFGGYDGMQRVNDLHVFNFTDKTWNCIHSNIADINAPSPRDRHIAVVWNKELYVFGGFDGQNRVNDLYACELPNFSDLQWRAVNAVSGDPPSPRHSHSAVVYQNSMYVFGGYDGTYKKDLHRFDFVKRQWALVHVYGDVPRARYRGTCSVYRNLMILHGGHDGSRHLGDTYTFNFETSTWHAVATAGAEPAPRDSHVSVVYKNSIYIFGGSTGNAMGDFHELKIDSKRWYTVQVGCSGGGRSGASNIGSMIRSGAASPSSSQRGEGMPGPRFCHIGVVYDGHMWIFGGYNGVHRLNDFVHYRLEDVYFSKEDPPSTLVAELRRLVNNELLSDVTFVVEGRPVRAHKVLCLRCPYFHTMLAGEYMESKASEIVIHDVRHHTFVQLMEYVYTDEVDITPETSMDLLQLADRFGVERLKKLCENLMLESINVESCALILYAADRNNATGLREQCMMFALNHFDEVSKTAGFEEVGRVNMDLVFEMLKRR